MMDKQKFDRLWSALSDELRQARDLSNSKPLLAHYTSIHVVESILTEGRLWMSNPLNMNDHQEVSYGIHLALNEVTVSQALRSALRSDETHKALLQSLQDLYNEYGSKDVKDLFVACFSEHHPIDIPDGKLSMWRGYGNYGDGAAVVLDTKSIEPSSDTPFVFSEVWYASDTQRRSEIQVRILRLAEFVAREGIGKSEVSGLAHALFRRIVLAAVFTKHIGFAEEQEWRLAYFPEYDSADQFKQMITYHHGELGLEPKLKLQIEPNDECNGLGLNLNEVVAAIMIGPRVGTPLNTHATITMLKQIGRPELIPKLGASSIPLRKRS